MTYSFQPDDLTGALVLEVRQRHKLSRSRFSELAGFTGRSTARLSNIENKDSWKPGDREAVARALTDLEGGRFDPRYHRAGVHDESPPTSAPVPITVLLDADDEPEDELADVVTDARPAPRAPAAPATPTIEPPPATDGVYRVSNGELQTWKRCRRKWWLAWYLELRLRTEELVGVRAVGDRVHRALSRWYVPEGHPRVDPRDALERVVVDDWTLITRLATERGLGHDQLADLARDFADSTNLERAMIEGYVRWLEETGADAELRVTASETPLSADLEVNVDGSSRPVRAIGLLDVRVTRVTDDRRLVLDHKTVGDLSSPAVTLPQNEQMLHYIMLEWLNSPDGETRCDGALYNMLRRVKRSARARPPFYDRVEVHHNSHELESYKRRMLATTRDVLRAVDALGRGESHLEVAYPSPKSDCRWDCDFFAVCNLLDDGSAGVGDMVRTLYKQADPRDRYQRTDGKNE